MDPQPSQNGHFFKLTGSFGNTQNTVSGLSEPNEEG
jgi:hypothetical protein